MSRKICIIGHFAFGKKALNGQTIKTQNLAYAFETYTDFELVNIDTYNWTKHPLALIGKIKKAFSVCDAVIMLPAHNGVKVFSPILTHYKKKYNKKIFYDVIGGWLPKMLSDKPKLTKTLKGFDGIWVETNTMKRKLEAQGFSNITLIKNFKKLSETREDELIYSSDAPFKLCTFSHVMKEKGIGDAIDVIKRVNERCGQTVYTLDIYGQIEAGNKEWFDGILAELPDFASYRGYIEADQSVQTLKPYFALLFPTRFYTEGVPGTIIDAYAAGIPVISAKWESFADVVDDGVTGIGYEFDNLKAFEDLLFDIASNPQRLSDMKISSLHKAKEFIPKTVIEMIVKEINK